MNNLEAAKKLLEQQTEINLLRKKLEKVEEYCSGVTTDYPPSADADRVAQNVIDIINEEDK